jgi:hypothetical protein
VPPGSTVHSRAIIAAVLALGLVLAIAASSWAAPVVTIDSGPPAQTREMLPSFDFVVDASALTVDCSLDQGIEAYAPCTSPYTAASSLGDGDWTFRVQASDGVDATVKTWSFTVDTAPPPLTIDLAPTGTTNDRTPSFEFTTDATRVECSVDQGTEAFVPCSSPYTPAALGDGSYTFHVRATDAAGNERELTQSFTVDATPPSLSIDSGPSGLTNRTTATFGFTVSGATRVECSIDQGTEAYRACTSGGSHTAAGLADGSYTFRVRATDAAGNERELTQSFTVDATPPSLSIDSGPSGPTNDTTPSFGFTAGADATTVECSIDHGTPAFAPCSAPFEPLAPLADGSYTFRVRAIDALGNPVTLTQDFAIDREAPSLSIDSGPSGPTNNTTPSFGFTAEPGARVECSVDQGSPTYRPCTTATSHTAALLAQGSYVFHVRATDGVGNPAETFRAFTVDTTPPSLSVTFGPSGMTNDNTPLFGFLAEAGATVECSIDQGTPAFGPCTDARAHAAGAPLADGAYTFRVQATDAADNQTTATRAFTVDTVSEIPGPESPRPDPTPPTTPPVTTPTTPTPSKPQLLSPFPLVRISGTLTPSGARIRLLTVRASPGTLVRVTVSPACSSRRRSRRCRVVQAAGMVGRRAVIGFRGLEHAYRSGTVIVVRVWRADRIGKYTRFTIVRGKAPRRVDQCLVPEATSGSRCPTG